MLIVYTGEGKGKTTAALGLVLRAAGYKRKTLIIQFGKASFTGEIEGIKKLKPYVKLIQGGKGFVKILGDKLPFKKHQETARKTFQKLFQETVSGKWDLVVADEILGALAGKLLTKAEVLKLIKNIPEKLDLVLTGRFVPREIIQRADLVTEMKKIKHPYDKGILAKEGIDY